MTDVVVHLSNTAPRHARVAHGMRRLLDELPDAVLRDIGLMRSDIPFVVGRLMSERQNPARESLDQFDWDAVWRNAAILRLPNAALRLALVTVAAVSAFVMVASAILAQDVGRNFLVVPKQGFSAKQGSERINAPLNAAQSGQMMTTRAADVTAGQTQISEFAIAVRRQAAMGVSFTIPALEVRRCRLREQLADSRNAVPHERTKGT